MTVAPPSARSLDRTFDLVAAIFLVGGVALFAIGRQALAALAAGTYYVAKGGTYVARAEYHDAQTRLGLWLVGAGILVALLSAALHARRRRRTAPRPATVP